MDDQTPPTKSGVHFEKIGQVALTVRDLERARNFYQETLGIKFLRSLKAFFQCGDIRLMIGMSEKPVSSSGTILYFKVSDIHGITSS